MKSYDVIVVGLGAMGSATLYQLAKRGVKVLGIDQFSPPHTFGSTHGDTRITRQAIAEGEVYVPLSLRSYEIWRELEEKSGEKLLEITGGLIMGSTETNARHFVENSIATAKKYNIHHEVWNAAQITSKFPQFKLTGSEIGYYEYNAGFLRPEPCVSAQLSLAQTLGAELLLNTKVDEVNQHKNTVTVKAGKQIFTAEKIIITAGPWVREFLPLEMQQYFKVYRQVLYWFEIAGPVENLLPKHFPIYNWELGGSGDNFVYGFPAVDGPNGGMKVATEQHIQTTNPTEVLRAVTKEEITQMYETYIKNKLTFLSDKCLKAVTCLYTCTPDSNFVIDFHPEYRNIILASPCSGHGFKHSAAIGEVLAQMATNEKSTIDITSLSFSRLHASV